MITTARFAAPAVIALLLLSACGDPDPGGLTNPSIRGEISRLEPGSSDVLGTALIEGKIGPDTQFDRASVRIDKDTDIWRMANGEPEDASFDDLAEGQTVEAWFEGPVAESYPVQAKAGKILILD